MLVIKDADFRMEQVKTSPFFDLKLLTVVNEGKSNERFEFKLDGYSMPFESCIDRIITHRLYGMNVTVSVTGYIDLYLKEVEKLNSAEIEIREISKADKEETEKEEDEDS